MPDFLINDGGCLQAVLIDGFPKNVHIGVHHNEEKKQMKNPALERMHLLDHRWRDSGTKLHCLLTLAGRTAPARPVHWCRSGRARGTSTSGMFFPENFAAHACLK